MLLIFQGGVSNPIALGWMYITGKQQLHQLLCLYTGESQDKLLFKGGLSLIVVVIMIVNGQPLNTTQMMAIHNSHAPPIIPELSRAHTTWV